jgi:rod shape-determining protein MreD
LKDVFFLMITGVLVLVLQSTFMGFLLPNAYKPDLFLVLVFWSSLRLPFLAGVGTAFVGGLLVDLLSGAPVGLFAVIYCSIFIACGSLNSVFQTDTLAGRVVTVFAATLTSAGTVLLVRMLTATVSMGSNSLLWFVEKAAITALSCLLFFPIMDRFRMAYVGLVGAR